ncbi:MAG: PA2928 family protein, partial [Phenylobacterium sp.]
ATGEKLWSRRLERDRAGMNMGRALLGAEAGTVWVLTEAGLVGLSAKDGTRLADALKIEAANPQLKGLLPQDPDLYRFDALGVGFTAADGRRWRIGGPALHAAAEGQAPKGAAFPPAHWSGGNGTWAFHERGVRLGQRWLGVLSDAEAGKSESAGVPMLVSVDQEPRNRLWSARVRARPGHFGPEASLHDFQPLPQGPEFVQAGLLTDGQTNAAPIFLLKPDSVLVLHRDRLDEAGRWRISRVAGPAGNVLWTAELQMKRLDAVMPGETSLAIQGSRPEPDPMRPRGRSETEVDVLAVIDLASGRTALHRFFEKPAPDR